MSALVPCAAQRSESSFAVDLGGERSSRERESWLLVVGCCLLWTVVGSGQWMGARWKADRRTGGQAGGCWGVWLLGCQPWVLALGASLGAGCRCQCQCQRPSHYWVRTVNPPRAPAFRLGLGRAASMTPMLRGPAQLDALNANNINRSHAYDWWSSSS